MRNSIVPWSKAYASNRVMLKDKVPLEMPLCIIIEPTNICNFKCLMCWQCTDEYKQNGGPFYNMDMDLFNKTITDISNWCKKSNKKIKLMKLYSTGEPLLNTNVTEMVRLIKELDICESLEITTNASMLTNEIAEKLVKYGLDYLRISVYSVDKIRHKRVTQNEILPEQILENIKYLRRYRDDLGVTKPFITAKIIDTHTDENNVFVKMYVGVSDEQIVEKPWDLPKLEENSLDRLYGSTENGRNAENEYIENCEASKKQVCRYPFTHMTVRNNGDVVVCCTDWSRDTKYGNIKDNSLEDIWKSKELRDFRIMSILTKGTNHPLCKDCPIPLQNKPEDNLEGFPIDKL